MSEVEKILSCLRKVHVSQLPGGEGDSARTNQLAALMTGAGYRSGHVAPRLASQLCINFFHHRATPDVKAGRRYHFPAKVIQVEAGFPRMALGIAYHLHNYCGYQESVSKSLAKSMVEVWIKNEVSYKSLYCICSENDKASVKNRLKNLLEVKGKKNPRSLDFSSLVDMTIKFFDIVNK